MEDLKAFQEQLRTQRPSEWDRLPDFSLYMDQVLSYMDRQVIRFDENDALTAAMVNNYTKNGLVPRAEGKKYGREHLAYLTAVCILKHVMSTRDTDLLIRDALAGGRSVAGGYEEFLKSLDSALRATADEMEAYLDPSLLVDSAIHFALLSYAAGAVSNRCVAMLRQQAEAETAAARKGKKERKEHA